MRLEIRNGRVIDPATGFDGAASVCIEEGRIAAVGAVPAGFVAERTIDATGHVVCPGLVDVAVRLREPGLEYKATLESELRAAVAGGVTSLACMPDTDPPLDEPGLVEMVKDRARQLDRAHVYPLGALTVGLAGVEITEMGELAEAGCVAFSQAEAPLTDTLVLLRAMQYAATFGHRVWLRPQDPHLGRAGVAHDGEVATRLGLPGIPVAAEVIALGTILALMRETGARVHVCRLSSAQGVEMVRAARKGGLPVTCDVGVHHLHLCDVDIGWFDTHCHVVPPLRDSRDRAALRAGLADGTIDLVCSDHAPVDEDGKQLPFAESAPGATGLELLLPLTLKWAREDRVPLARALASISSAPAAVLGCPGGHLAPGAPADLCIFDPEASWVVAPEELASQGKNTPFAGYELTGRACTTLVGGKVVFAR